MMDYETWKLDLKNQNLWRQAIDIIKEKNLYYRYKIFYDDELSHWDGLIEPVECCIESGWYGPVAKWEVEWIEVNPILKERVGTFQKEEDYTDYLCKRLAESHLKFEIVDGNIRVFVNDS